MLLLFGNISQDVCILVSERGQDPNDIMYFLYAECMLFYPGAFTKALL